MVTFVEICEGSEQCSSGTTNSVRVYKAAHTDGSWACRTGPGAIGVQAETSDGLGLRGVAATVLRQDCLVLICGGSGGLLYRCLYPIAI